jgi:hypothetical protein
MNFLEGLDNPNSGSEGAVAPSASNGYRVLREVDRTMATLIGDSEAAAERRVGVPAATLSTKPKTQRMSWERVRAGSGNADALMCLVLREQRYEARSIRHAGLLEYL